MKMLLSVIMVGLSFEAFGTMPIPNSWEGVSTDIEIPSRRELVPFDSADSEDRQRLLKQLTSLMQFYRVETLKAKADHLGDSSIHDYLNRKHYLKFIGASGVPRLRELDKIQTSLSWRHASWLLKTGRQAFENDPPDWRVVSGVLQVALRVQHRDELESLARDVLRAPLPQELDITGPRVRAIRWSLSYFRREWPVDAVDVFETIMTLPHQPVDRTYFPIRAEEERPREVEQTLASSAIPMLQQLRSIPDERGWQLLERMEPHLEAPEQKIDDEVRTELIRLRERLEEVEAELLEIEERE